jgi:hypothetical protein
MDNTGVATSEPRICPFLRAARDGQLGNPVRWPDGANACTALGDPAPQSLRQQEYACLASAHVNCPRFLRGVHLLVETGPVQEAGLRMTPAILGALLVLALSFALSVGFVVANGGMALPGSPGGSAQAGVMSAPPSTDASPSLASEAPVLPSVAPSVEPSAAASVGSATATPTAAPTPTPTPTATPLPSSDRYALLEPCGDAPDCWIYTVREGDNLVSIARYFGVPFDVVTARNPWTETTPLVAGQELRLPPPTR